jgi:hypothetical protein
LRVHAALETIAGVRDDALFAPRAGDPRRIEPGGFDEDVFGVFKAARIHPAHDTRDAARKTIVGNNDSFAVQHIGLFVQRQYLLMILGHAGMQVAAEFVGIEHMQRPARSWEIRLVASTRAEMDFMPTLLSLS